MEKIVMVILTFFTLAAGAQALNGEMPSGRQMPGREETTQGRRIFSFAPERRSFATFCRDFAGLFYAAKDIMFNFAQGVTLISALGVWFLMNKIKCFIYD